MGKGEERVVNIKIILVGLLNYVMGVRYTDNDYQYTCFYGYYSSYAF